MVKADPKHDYYADLDCKPNADATEIKKAFKKLALKYHPDRNRGHEEEASHKFQDMSQAYEILTDPEKRAKYDADRWRHTLHAARAEASTDSPPRSPFVVNTGFPPPPRRTQPQPQPQAQGAPPPPPRNPGGAPTAKQPSSGANRYANFTRKFAQTHEEQAKAQASYSAWEQMKHRGNQAGPPPPPPRRQPRPNSYAAPNAATAKQRAGWEDTPPAKPGPPPPDAYANGVPNTPRPGEPGKSPKRPTFFPGPEAPDEPPNARQPSAYYNMRGGRPPQPMRPASPFAPNVPNAPPPSGFRHVNPRQTTVPTFKVPPQEDVGNRQSAPYATAGGEKTYLGSETINRSASTAANLHAGWADHRSRDSSRSGANVRHRSASPHMRSPRPPDDYSDSSSSDSSSTDDEEEDERDVRNRGHYARRASADDRYRATFTHPKHPNVTVEVDEDDDKLHPRRPPNGTRTSERPTSSGGPTEGFQQHRMRVSPGRSPNPINTQPMEKPRPPPAAPNGRQGPVPNGRHVPPIATDVRSKSPNFFIPNDPSTSGSSTKNSSTENVNSRFSPSAWQDKFTDPNTYLGAQRPVRSNTGGSTGPPGTTSRGRSPLKPRSATTSVFPPTQTATPQDSPLNTGGPPTARPNGPIPAPEPVPPKFPQTEWQQHFKEPTWAYPGGPPTPKGRPKTPRKGSVHTKKGSMPSKPAGFPGASAGEAAAAAFAAKRSMSEHSIHSVHSTHSNGSAMDLDPKPEPVASAATSRQPSMAMRDDPIANIIRSAVPPTAKKDEFDEFDDDPLAFEALKHTDPLVPSKQGLFGMGDLATTLPFESQPSSDPAAQHAPRARELPPVPAAPDAPANPTLTQSGWEQYVSHFDSYLLQWSMFNQRMLNHFQARQNALQQLPKKWTTLASGDGLARYVAGVEEDFRVRDHWDKGWEKHRDNMAAFAKARARAAKGDLLEV